MLNYNVCGNVSKCYINVTFTCNIKCHPVSLTFNVIKCYQNVIFKVTLNVTMFSDILMLWNVIKCYQMSHFGDMFKTKATLNVPLFKGYQMLPNVTKCCKMLPNVGTIFPDSSFR